MDTEPMQAITSGTINPVHFALPKPRVSWQEKDDVKQALFEDDVQANSNDVDKDARILEFWFENYHFVGASLQSRLPTIKEFQDAFNTQPRLTQSSKTFFLAKLKEAKVLNVWSEDNFPDLDEMDVESKTRLRKVTQAFIEMESTEDAHYVETEGRWQVEFRGKIVTIKLRFPPKDSQTRKVYRKIATVVKYLEQLDEKLYDLGAVAGPYGSVILPGHLLDIEEFDAECKRFEELMKATDPVTLHAAGYSDLMAVQAAYSVMLGTRVKVDRKKLKEGVDRLSKERFSLVKILAGYDQSRYPFQFDRCYSNTVCKWTLK